MGFAHIVTAEAEAAGSAAGEEGIAAGHRAQEEGLHMAAGRMVAGTAVEEEGLGCSRIVACTFGQCVLGVACLISGMLTAVDSLLHILLLPGGNCDTLGLGMPFCKVMSAECRAQVLRAEGDRGV